jgi:hypothetical protein
LKYVLIGFQLGSGITLTRSWTPVCITTIRL